jgi:tRNA/rRNA methyltransferase
VAIVLVEPENPDNIGASARAMKNMGLADLRLVGPPANWQYKARKMAMSARDVSENACVFPDLKSALEDAHLVIGTTRRFGAKRGVFLSFEEGIGKIKRISKKKRVAILFGKESKGLDNRALNHCDFLMAIPADKAYASLNLAQAVLTVAFSLFREPLLKNKKISDQKEMAYDVPKKVIHDVFNRLRQSLVALGYEREGRDVIDRILATFSGLLKRNGLLEPEAQMFKGISRKICEKNKKE